MFRVPPFSFFCNFLGLPLLERGRLPAMSNSTMETSGAEFTYCFGVSIVNFEQVNACCVGLARLLCPVHVSQNLIFENEIKKAFPNMC